MNCGVPGCIRPARSERIFLCYRHWWLTPRPIRQRVRDGYRAWERGYGSLDVLRSVQQEAVDAVTRRSTA